MIVEGTHNTLEGQYQEFVYKVDESIRFKIADNFIYIQDANNNDVIRFRLDQGLLKYSIYNSG
jgi:hypothetical protein